MSTRATRGKQRSIRLTTGSPENLGEHFCFAVTVNGKEDFYAAVELATDYGRGFSVHKEGEPNAYDVLLDNRHSTCECPGFAYRGSCRHLQGLHALIGQGQLPPVRPVRERLGSLREVDGPFIPGRSDEPAYVPLSERFRSLGSAMKHCPEAFYGNTEYPDDAA
ncbi:MAG: hypothetical protein JNM56_29025 [Planctomycetia bacterium]|nr:hypothetical protein [Planctomycetia bacterium]